MKLKIQQLYYSFLLMIVVPIAVQLQAQNKIPTYKADVPKSIQTPNIVKTTRLGTLKFFDGMPDDSTVKKVYDNLDFMNGVQTFLTGMPAASIYAMCTGLESTGATVNNGFDIWEDLMDARSLTLTPNSTTIYIWGSIDLSKGPVVLEASSGVLGIVDDAYFRFYNRRWYNRT